MSSLSGARSGYTTRSSTGCWTCRVRRKKCDEKRPVCDSCDALHITCNYDPTKPEWMDNGTLQQEMSDRIKREVKENAHLRRDRTVRQSIPDGSGNLAHLPSNSAKSPPSTSDRDTQLYFGSVAAEEASPNGRCTIVPKGLHGSTEIGQSEAVLLMFYIEHLLPFLFPFYQPSPLEGGKAWVLQLMLRSPAMRQALLCQSSYFFSLAQGTADSDAVWDTMLTQTRDVFEILRQATQIIYSSDTDEHLHGAARIMASILQVQRFEIAISSFSNCRAHLDAALALFTQLLDSAGPAGPTGWAANFETLLGRLGPSPWISSAKSARIMSAEQAAFRFSSGLLIFDDIVASTVLREQPKLYEHHRSLLTSTDGSEPTINLETMIGCRNCVMIQIGEIASLDAWKRHCKADGSFDVMELVRRAFSIKDLLEAEVMRLETESTVIPSGRNSLLDVFATANSQLFSSAPGYSARVTYVWAHAALIYLSVVVSGWQPASAAVRHHVNRILGVLTCQLFPPSLVRTMAWPFCVAGCFAEPAQESHFRHTAESLKPPSVFGTVRKALEIMENAWRNRDVGDVADRDLAACFGSQGDLVLLV